MIIIILAIVWYIIGCLSFIYWWIKEFDFDVSCIIIMLSAGVLGLLAWPIGYIIHGDKSKIFNSNKVLIKQRKK